MFYVDTELSPRQATLPSGSLWCRDVVVARTGLQTYHRSELFGVDTDAIAGRDGMVRVVRDAAEVFDPNAMSSFEGAPVTLGHPDMPVDPSTWRDLSVGHAQGVRRIDDHLVADLLVHDARGIHAIRDLGWRAVSCGYDAAYRPDGRGRLRQTDIRGNHIALLPPDQEARCGDVCRVGDAAGGGRKTMKHTRDQSVGAEHRAWTMGPNNNNQMGEGNGRVGPSLIMELPGPASAYFILDLPPGDRCAVVASAGINGKLDMGSIASGSNALPDARRRTLASNDAQRIATIKADMAGSSARLKAINAANAAFWRQQQGKA
jgi:hypothetical protein